MTSGSEVSSLIAAPVAGGMVPSAVLALLEVPAIYALVKETTLFRKNQNQIIHNAKVPK